MPATPAVGRMLLAAGLCILSAAALSQGLQAAAQYTIIISTATPEDAQFLEQELVQKGFPAFLGPDDQPEVRVGSFDNKAEAQAASGLLAEQGYHGSVDEDDEEAVPCVDTAAYSATGQAPPPAATGAYDDPRAQRIVSLALSLFGQPYKYGGMRVGRGIDCSYFTQIIYRDLGITLPRTSREQFVMGLSVSSGSLKVGDLLFFQKTYRARRRRAKQPRRTYTRINHVGIYIGRGEFIHATLNVKRVTISRLDEPYFIERFAGARRILSEVSPRTSDRKSP